MQPVSIGARHMHIMHNILYIVYGIWYMEQHAGGILVLLARIEDVSK